MLGPSPRAIDSSRFRQVLGQYPTGVSLVTGIAPEGSPVGFAVGSFTSVSLDPPLVAFLPAKSSGTWPRIASTGHFCINILSADQEQLCRVFASNESDRFRGLDWWPAATGSPIIDGVVAWVDCDLEAVHEAGDHYIAVGRVRELDVEAPALPLLFFQGGYGAFAPLSLASGDATLSGRLRLVDIARPEMEALATDLDLRCITAALVGEDLVLLASAGGAVGQAPAHLLIGQRTPAVPPLATLWMAFAEESDVEAWLQRGGVTGERNAYRRRLQQVRERGYSVGLHGPAHAEFERLLADQRAVRPSGSLAGEARAVIRKLLYDPLDFRIDGPQEVRSLHAPVFDADGRVSLALALFGLPRNPTPRVLERHTTRLLATARRVTELSGGSEPYHGRSMRILSS